MIGDLREQTEPFFKSLAGRVCVCFALVATVAGVAGVHHLTRKIQPLVVSLPLQAGGTTNATSFECSSSGTYFLGMNLHPGGTNWLAVSEERRRLPSEIVLNWSLIEKTQTLASGKSPTNWPTGSSGGNFLSLGKGLSLEAGSRYTLVAQVEKSPFGLSAIRPELILRLKGSEQIAVSLRGWVSLGAAILLGAVALVCGLSYLRYRC